jgi:hypothetical protein
LFGDTNAAARLVAFYEVSGNKASIGANACEEFVIE